MSTVNDTGARHYRVGGGTQPWDFIAEQGLDFFEGNIIKYVVRWKRKNGVDDLRKARHYLDKLIEMEVTE